MALCVGAAHLRSLVCPRSPGLRWAISTEANAILYWNAQYSEDTKPGLDPAIEGGIVDS
jgi:hypothetical protein